jgi:hypothetical protein
MKCEIEIMYNYKEWVNINDVSESLNRLKDPFFIQNVIRASTEIKKNESPNYKLDFNWGCESLIVSIMI